MTRPTLHLTLVCVATLLHGTAFALAATAWLHDASPHTRFRGVASVVVLTACALSLNIHRRTPRP